MTKKTEEEIKQDSPFSLRLGEKRRCILGRISLVDDRSIAYIILKMIDASPKFKETEKELENDKNICTHKPDQR